MHKGALICCVLLFAPLAVAQNEQAKRLADVRTVRVLQESKTDVEYLGNVSPSNQDYKNRQERLTWLRAVRQAVAKQLADHEVVQSTERAEASNARLTITFTVSQPPLLETPRGSNQTPLRSAAVFDTGRVTVMLFSSDKFFWQTNYFADKDAGKVARKIVEELTKTIQKDRAKQMK